MNSMQTLKYQSGIWMVEATLYKLSEVSRMATISAAAGQGKAAICSKHTVVFEHAPGSDDMEEAKGLTQRILKHSH